MLGRHAKVTIRLQGRCVFLGTSARSGSQMPGPGVFLMSTKTSTGQGRDKTAGSVSNREGGTDMWTHLYPHLYMCGEYFLMVPRQSSMATWSWVEGAWDKGSISRLANQPSLPGGLCLTVLYKTETEGKMVDVALKATWKSQHLSSRNGLCPVF